MPSLSHDLRLPGWKRCNWLLLCLEFAIDIELNVQAVVVVVVVVVVV